MGAADRTLGYTLTGDASGLNAAIESGRKNAADFAAETVKANQSISESAATALDKQAKLSAAQYKAAADAKTVAAATQVQAGSLTDLLAKIDPVVGKLGQLDSQLDQLKKFKSSGAIDGADFAEYASKIESSREALTDVSKTQTELQLNTSNVRREFGLLIKDLLSGNFGQAQRELGTLAGSTNLIGFAFSAAGAAILSTLVVLGSAVALVVSAHNEVDGFNRALISTGNYAGVTAQGLVQLTTTVGQQTGKYGEAQDALTKLAQSGRLTGDDLRYAGQGAVDFASLTGKSIDEAVSEFEKLAKDPKQAALELDEQLHFLTGSTYEQIAALQDEGDKTSAVTVAVRALADTLRERKEEYKATQGEIAQKWDSIKSSIDGAVNSAKNFFNQHAPGDGLDLQTILNPAAFIGNVGLAIGDVIEGSGKTAEEVQGAQNLANANAAATASEKAKTAAVNEFDVVNAAANAKEIEAYEKEAVTAGQSKLALAQYNTEKQQLAAAAKFSGQALLDETARIIDNRAAVESEAAKVDAATASKKNATKEAERLNAEQTQFLTLTQKGTDAVNRYADSNDKEAQALHENQAAQSDANKLYKDAADLYAHGKISLDDYTKSVQLSTEWSAQAKAKYEDQVDILTRLKEVQTTTGTALDQLLKNWRDQDAALGSLGDEYKTLRAEEQAVKAVDDAYRQTLIQLKDATIAQRDAARDEWLQAQQSAVAHADYTIILQKERSLISDWAQSAEQDFGQAFQAINKDIIEGGSVMKDLVDLSKQVVEQIIFEFEKLAAINPILNAVFGGSRADLSTAQGAIGLLLNNSGGGGAGGSIGGGLFNPSSWISAGQNLFSGFQSTAGNLWSQATGAYTYTPSGVYGPSSELANDFSGPPSALAGPGPGAYGGYNSALGQGLGIAGGAYAGYSEFNNAGGGAAGIAGGLAYGTGTYLIGAGITAAMSGGISAGVAALGSLGPVGWVAIAAMLVDKFSGGKLFGTSYQTIGATQSLNVGPDGASADLQLQQEKQSALFGGKKDRDKTGTVTPEMLDAANQLEASYKTLVEGVAKSIAIETPDILAESLSVVQKFDKKGKVTSTDYQVNVNGQVYSEATAELQQTRGAAEQIVNTISHSDIGKDAETIAQQWRTSADTLMDGAQLLVAATTDIVNSQGLLGDSGTLGDTVDEVEKLQVSGESLVQTYARLQVETQSLHQALDLTGANIGKTGDAFVEFADDVVTAAGGLDKAKALWTAFVQDFYSPQEIAKQQIDTARPNVSKELTDIGLDPGISLGDFRKAYEAALPTLTPEQLVQWQQAGVDLAQFTDAVTQFNNAVDQSKQKYTDAVNSLDLELGNVSQLSVTIAGIRQWSKDASAQLNDLAKAAGKASASESDLTKVQEVAAQRMADAIAQLNSSSADLASKLGYTDTLDSLNAQIAALQSGAGSAADGISSAVDNISNANDKLNLQIGDLSPYSDNKKLELAMQGLKAGTVAPETVLQIARRLDASGDDYNKVFEQVLALTGNATAGASATSGLNYSGISANNGQLDELIAKRDALEASQRKQDAQQLAQNIADMAQAEGESVEQVATEIGGGINLNDLAKDLGIGQDQISTYLTSLEKQDVAGAVDSSGDDVVKAVNASGDKIVDAINGGDTSRVAKYNGPSNAQPIGTAPPDTGTSGSNVQPAPPSDDDRQRERDQVQRDLDSAQRQERMVAALEIIASNTGDNADLAQQTLRALSDSNLLTTARTGGRLMPIGAS